MPIHRGTHCSYCRAPAIKIGAEVQRLTNTDRFVKPYAVCIAHDRQNRYADMRGPTGYGCWGCPSCEYSYVHTTLSYSGDLGSFSFEYEYDISDYEYDPHDDPLYVTLSWEYIMDDAYACAYAAHAREGALLTLATTTGDVPDDEEHFLQHPDFEEVRALIHDNLTVGHIFCNSCGTEIPGEAA